MTLNFKQFGDGPPLIILHGLFGSLDNWQTLARKYGEYFTTYIIDQRNHGKSPHVHEMNLSLMASDIILFMDEHDISNSSFIGHSMGGKVTQHIAFQFPERCNKVITADIGIKQYDRRHDNIFDAISNLDLEIIASRRQADEVLEESIPEFGVRLFILKGLQRNETSYSWKFNTQILLENYDALIAATTYDLPSEVEIRFLYGELSDYVQDEDQSSILELFPNASFDSVSNAGHWLHADNPVEFFKKSLNYLR